MNGNLKIGKLSMAIATLLVFVLATHASAATKDPRLEYVRNKLVAAKLNKTTINKILSDKRIRLYSIKTVAYKEPDWSIIKKKLYADAFVQKGKDYIQKNQEIFNKAESDFGIRKEVLAGVIAIETDFGRNTGGYITFNVIYSRMKTWPASKWQGQANELIALSKFCIQNKIDCFRVKGSYAGAFGLTQFMPSSVLSYGVDGDKDGVIDMMNPADAIPSTANFLKEHGWDRSQLHALASYYGSSVGYPEIVLDYASLLSK